MGGRGAFLNSGGFSKQEYKSVKVINAGVKIKVLQKINSGSVGLPGYSKSSNAVYASYRKGGAPKQIQYYKDRKSYKRVDLDHSHGKYKSWHTQETYNGKDITRKLSKREKRHAKTLFASR